MNVKPGALVLALCLLGAAGAASAAEPDPTQVAAARAATKQLGMELKAQLMAAIKAGGPVEALSVCKTVAPAIADAAGAARGLKVGRTALRVRNPANAPDDWERTVLADFARQIKAGADPAKLERAETVTDAGGVTEFRYMKAIPMTAQPCLTCHGNPEPSLKAAILKLYPGDAATGFHPGELRGAFTVRAPALQHAPAPAPVPAP